MAITSIDTATVAAPDRLDFWREAVCDQFVTLDVRPLEDVPSRGRVTAAHVGETLVRRIEAGPHRFARTQSLVRRADEEYLQIEAGHVRRLTVRKPLQKIVDRIVPQVFREIEQIVGIARDVALRQHRRALRFDDIVESHQGAAVVELADAVAPLCLGNRAVDTHVA